MKKRFLVAAMACAVALGGFAGFVKAEEPTAPKVTDALTETLNSEEYKKVDEVIRKLADKLVDEKGSDKDVQTAKKIEELTKVVYNAVYVNTEKNATAEEVKAYKELFDLLNAHKADSALYMTLFNQLYAGVTELKSDAIPGDAWDALSKVKKNYLTEKKFKDALLNKKDANKKEDVKKEAGKAEKKALPNTAAVK